MTPLSAELREGLARAICEATGLDWGAQKDPMTSGGGDDDAEGFRDMADAAIAYLWPLAMEHAAKLAQNFKGLPNEMLVAAIRAQEPPK